MYFELQWKNISEQTAPQTRISMIGQSSGKENPIRCTYLISGGVGLELSGRLLPRSADPSPTLRHMEFEEVENISVSIEALFAGKNEWNGSKVRVSTFTL